MNIYVASSWRCEYQPVAVILLRQAGLKVYDFRNPDGGTGFGWKQIDPDWQTWSVDRYREALTHPLAEAGFKADFDALNACNAVVLVLPSGRSAHVEAAWAKGQGKSVWVWSPEPCEPELMYKLFDGIGRGIHEIISWIRQASARLELSRHSDASPSETAEIVTPKGSSRS